MRRRRIRAGFARRLCLCAGFPAGSGLSYLLKWSFLFWVGQALTVAGMLGVALRMMR